MPQGEVQAWKAELARVKVRAKWIGVATFEANNSDTFPFTDSESSRWKADAARRRREEAKKGIDGRKSRRKKERRPTLKPEEGGHTVVRATGCKGWICSVCRVTSSVKAKLETQSCNKAGKTWGAADGRQHSVRKSGLITWCGTCGAWAETRARRLTAACLGPPSLSTGGGRRAQLNKLRAGLHPVSLCRLPEALWPNGTPVIGNGKYARLRASGEQEKPEGFKLYVPYDQQIGVFDPHFCLIMA